jgi:hypothetical protein
LKNTSFFFLKIILKEREEKKRSRQEQMNELVNSINESHNALELPNDSITQVTFKSEAAAEISNEKLEYEFTCRFT